MCKRMLFRIATRWQHLYSGGIVSTNKEKVKKKSQDIVDRTGFEKFKQWALKNVTLPAKAEVMSPVYWKGTNF